MIQKLKKRFLSLLLVLCYCTGNLLFPIYADTDLSGFDELLSEREEFSDSETKVQETVKKISIEDFTDVKTNDWFYSYLGYLVERGLVNGKTESSFEPYSTFSYAECSAVIVRYLGLEEEASKRMKEISRRDSSLSNQWYLGYFEVLENLGIFTDYDLFEAHDGKIVSVDKEAANSPVVRYRFAESISKSFELESELKARNVYSEIGGSGREFIVGGGYKEEILEEYKDYITDIDEIPEESLEYILKAYYNGIFNGDVSGCFYPHNNLTRGEMAKVLATVSDYSLRTRLIDDGYGEEVTQDMLHTDAFGVQTMDFDVWKELLLSHSGNISTDGGVITYENSLDVPFGYAIDAYLYKEKDGGYVLAEQCTLHDFSDGSFVYDGNSARILLVLRNTRENARSEGVLDVRISDGAVISAEPLIRTM